MGILRNVHTDQLFELIYHYIDEKHAAEIENLSHPTLKKNVLQTVYIYDIKFYYLCSLV
jgi:hypothetical protein